MIEITLRIPDTKVLKAKEGFLYLHPVPIEDDKPIMSENAWVREWLRRKLSNEIDRGLHKRALDNIEFDSDDSLVE